MSWHKKEIKSSVDSFLPIKFHKTTIARNPTNYACTHDRSLQPIQVEVTNLGQVNRSLNLRI